MTRKTHKPRRPAAGGSTSRLAKFLLAAFVLLATLTGTVTVTERQQWPKSLRDIYAVKLAYAVRDVVRDRLQPPPADGKPAETGYKDDDRARLDALISEGPQTP